MYEYIHFQELRNLIRSKYKGASGLPLYGSEGVAPASVPLSELHIVKRADSSVQRFMEAKKEIVQAAIAGIREFPSCCGAILNAETREVVLPPIVEVYAGVPTLIDGFEAYYSVAEQSESQVIRAVVIKRTTMASVPPVVVPVPVFKTYAAYVRHKKWDADSAGQERVFSLQG